MTDPAADGAPERGMAAENGSERPERVWVDIAADADIPITEVESLCMNCHDQGVTRLLLTKIPYFREIILSAFDCPHCHFRDSFVQSAETIQDRGVRQTVHVTSKRDLNRQIVKSDTATVRFVEVDFEIPAQRGVLTTVEGLVQSAVEGISQDQPLRRVQDEETWRKIEDFLAKLQDLLDLKDPAGFHVVVDDPAGNSFIENVFAPATDPQISTQHYDRTPEQNEQLGIAEEPTKEEPLPDVEEIDADAGAIPEILRFPASCSSCGAPSETRMHILTIPHFKEVVIMSTTCDACGYKSNEVKAGGPVAARGRRIELRVAERDDYSRDLLKSETCGVRVPEVELELTHGTLGGKFTTVEGLLVQVRQELAEKVPFVGGDSATEQRRRVFEKFMAKLDRLLSMEVLPWTLVLDDPLGNSYLQNPYAPDPDPNMTIVEYERTREQDEEWGIADMKTEGYAEDGAAEGGHA